MSPSRQAADAATIGTPAGANGVSTSVITAARAAAWRARRSRRYGTASARNSAANAASSPSAFGSSRTPPIDRSGRRAPDPEHVEDEPRPDEDRPLEPAAPTRQRPGLVDDRLRLDEPPEPPAGEDRGNGHADRDVARVEEDGGENRRRDRPSGIEHRDRGELRRAGERRRRHGDRRSGSESGRIRENAERRGRRGSGSARAEGPRACRRGCAARRRVRRPPGNLRQRPHAQPACHNRASEDRRQRRVRAHRISARRRRCAASGHEVARLVRREPSGSRRDPLGPGRRRARRRGAPGHRRDREPERREHRSALDRVAQARDPRLPRPGDTTCSHEPPQRSTRARPCSSPRRPSGATAIAATRS